MSRRVSLGDLAERSPVSETPAPQPRPAEAVEANSESLERPAEAPTKTKAPSRKPKSQPPATSKTSTAPPSSGDGWQRYDAYERKESRLRPDQSEALGELSRRLNRTRAGQGERLTENTLIRVAIDLLVARSEDLTGTTEAELRRSVGL